MNIIMPNANPSAGTYNESVIRLMSDEEQVTLLKEAWSDYKLYTIDQENARLRNIKGAKPDPSVYHYADLWVKALEDFHHCWRQSAIEQFLSNVPAEELCPNKCTEPSVDADASGATKTSEELITHLTPEEAKAFNKAIEKRHPMKRVTKGIKKGAKGVAKGVANTVTVTAKAAGTVACCAAGIAVAPVVIPVMTAKYYKSTKG